MTGDFIFGALLSSLFAYAIGYLHGAWRHTPSIDDERPYGDGAWLRRD